MQGVGRTSVGGTFELHMELFGRGRQRTIGGAPRRHAPGEGVQSQAGRTAHDELRAALAAGGEGKQ